MQRLKDKNITLYERIEELEKRRTEQNDKPVFQAFQAFQDNLSLCNNLDNLQNAYGTVNVPYAFYSQEHASKQEPAFVEQGHRDTKQLPEETAARVADHITVDTCYCCKQRKYWVDHYGNRKCGVCHPSVMEKIVGQSLSF